MEYLSKQRKQFASVPLYLYKYAELGSTNDEASTLLEAEQQSIVVTAQFQTSGKGRRGRTWSGLKGENIYMSIGLHQPQWTRFYTDYQFLACLAVLDVLRSTVKTHSFVLKYPNDILVSSDSGSAKIAGILVETEFRSQELQNCICGIGVNINQSVFTEELAQVATSLSILTNNEYDTDDIIENILLAFCRMLSQTSESVFQRWSKELSLENKRIHVIDTNENYIVQNIVRNGSIELQNCTSGERSIMDQTNSFRMVVDG